MVGHALLFLEIKWPLRLDIVLYSNDKLEIARLCPVMKEDSSKFVVKSVPHVTPSRLRFRCWDDRIACATNLGVRGDSRSVRVSVLFQSNAGPQRLPIETNLFTVSMGVGRIFSRAAKNGEVIFFPLTIEKTTFFARNFIEKCQISKSREDFTPLPTPMQPMIA